MSTFEPFCAAFSAAMVVTVTEYVPPLGSNLFRDTVVFALDDEWPNVLDDIAACTSCRNGRKTGMHWTMIVPVISAENLTSLSVNRFFDVETSRQTVLTRREPHAGRSKKNLRKPRSNAHHIIDIALRPE